MPPGSSSLHDRKSTEVGLADSFESVSLGPSALGDRLLLGASFSARHVPEEKLRSFLTATIARVEKKRKRATASK